MAREFGDALLVADSGYANTSYMITPLLRVTNRAEGLFNESLIRTRNPVERQYGVWKRQFPVLSLGLRLKLETPQAVVIATAVLHNLALDRDSLPPEGPDVGYMPQEDQTEYVGNADLVGNTNARDRLITEYFANL